MFTGSIYVNDVIANKEGKNLNSCTFSIFYNPRNKTGKLVGSNSSGEVFSRDLFGSECSFLDEPSYLFINVELESGSAGFFNINFCILEDGKCKSNGSDQTLAIYISSGVGGFICLAFLGFLVYFGCQKKRRNLKRNPEKMEMKEKYISKHLKYLFY